MLLLDTVDSLMIDGLKYKDTNALNATSGSLGILKNIGSTTLKSIVGEDNRATPNIFTDTSANNTNISAERTGVLIGDLPAGTNKNFYLIVPQQNGHILKASIINQATIPQDNTDYIRFTVQNLTTASVMSSGDTQVGGLTITANTESNLHAAAYLYGNAQKFDKYDIIEMQVLTIGAGQPLTGAKFMLEYVPIGNLH